MSENALIDLVQGMDHLPVVPLLGFPGIQTTKSTVRQNMFNYGLHFRSLMNLVKRYNPDTMFMMMDLSLEMNALGGPVRYDEFAAPSVLDHTVVTEDDLEALYKINIRQDARINGFLETMRLMVKYFNVMPAAYVIGPFTLASHLLGASNAAKATIKNVDFLHKVLDFTVGVIKDHVDMLTKAGAEMICVLEPSAMGISPKSFGEFSQPYLERIYTGFKPYSVLHICGNSSHLVERMADCGVQGLSLDAGTDLVAAAEKVADKVVIIGNVPPVEVVWEQSPHEVYSFTQDLMRKMSPFRNFILATGCDLPPDTPLENVQAMMNAARGLPLDAAPEYPEAFKEDEAAILAALS
ncbi:MAG: uroporphyrinogen decarboxylase family protein [Anaerolineaceae bacterium]|nr:uroporphyrinogen decarboxylase family protein [Anaerolineaceae bacterium]